MSRATAPPSLFQAAGQRFQDLNQGWISQLFEAAHWVDACEDDGVITHTFRGRLRRPAAPAAPAGARCGDDGGRTKAGHPCRRRPADAGRRCRLHPRPQGSAGAEADARAGDPPADDPPADVHVRLPADAADRRPIPWPAPRSSVAYRLAGTDPWLRLAEDRGSPATVLVTAWAHVVNQVMLLPIKAALGLPCESVVYFRPRRRWVACEPTWDVARLAQALDVDLARHALVGRQGPWLAGHLLSDYGVQSHHELPKESRQGRSKPQSVWLVQRSQREASKELVSGGSLAKPSA